MTSESVHIAAATHLRAAHLRPRRALRAVESFLLSGGQQTARRNAWAAVVEDRRRARDRREAQYEMDALVSAARGSALND
ncbi:hypothetical protein SAMN05216251_10761 [Actinacidiphila alni]|uniref:Uncharacterized protein n=1 Tax=Actinacidiphila alni TaxID=380248 RepID=A0A1I2EZ46_9ACTN|nr:hypothetical protein [Actinacidiphila alni]SFE98059.1 hypothetical protein SAMN05216251_10761 [Actinacidiphila alni]